MDTLIGKVPDDWTQVRLAQVCEVLAGPSGASLNQAARRSPDVPVVMPRDFRNNQIVEDNLAMIALEAAKGLSRYRLIPGDVVCARNGELGRQALVGHGQKGWLFGTACLRLRVGTSISPRYLIYYLGHPAVRDWIMRNATGSAIRTLNAKTLGSMPVVLPPGVVQSAIGEVLSALDEKVAVHDQISRTAAALRDSLIPWLVAGSSRINQA
jgi:restriction endonuclease S subunit